MPRIPVPFAMLTAIAVAAVVGAIFTVPEVSGDDGGRGGAAPATSAPDPLAEARRAWQVRSDALSAALAGYAAGNPEFGVGLIDNRTGFTYGYLGDRAFETASVAKVDILAAVLLTAQDEGRELTARESRLAGLMIGVSDNAAASSLYDQIGGADGLRAANARLGLTGTVPDDSWGLTRTTPSDAARLISALLVPDGAEGPFSDYSRQTAESLMTSVDADQAWGISAAAKEGERAALKNGWLSRDTEDDTWIVNSAGRITGGDVDLTLVVLSHGNKGFGSGVDHVRKVATMTRERIGL
ncbi:serine hydrolase [Catenuloplanes atrovinosus]|uniref:Beta-lactamase class A n=1 Tax=Catenuloplanes atrovinosus TaxID=137266 RepID=A0AAE3YJR9_9ACTN|nr:serine hydrolase [Catenuloplanes atrovinosus]MDR7273715.1 beta-lactamase class A [Catenuloplanes atrovinosus]